MSLGPESKMQSHLSLLLIGTVGLFLAFFLQTISNVINSYSNLSVLASAYSQIRSPPFTEYQILVFSAFAIMLTVATILLTIIFRALVPLAQNRWTLLLVGVATADFLFLPVLPMITGLLSPVSVLNVAIVNATVPMPERIMVVQDLNSLWNFVVFLRFFIEGVIVLAIVIFLTFVTAKFPVGQSFGKQMTALFVISAVVILSTIPLTVAESSFAPSYHSFFFTATVTVTVCSQNSTCPIPASSPPPANPLAVFSLLSYVLDVLELIPVATWIGFSIKRVVLPLTREQT